MARTELNITYYPEGAKTIEDRISVGDLVKALVGETRKKHAKEIENADFGEYQGATAGRG